MGRKLSAVKKAEEDRKKAIKIRDEARLLKKEAQEILKKQRMEQRPGKGIVRDENGSFAPGNDSSGRGQPRVTFSLKRLVREKLEEIEPRNKKTYAELLVNQVIKKAIVKGDDTSIRLIFNYLEGMPKQTLEGNVDIKTALVNFIGGPVKKIEPMEPVEAIEPIESTENIEPNETELLEDGSSSD
jgi:hypothetical protein